MHTTKTEVHQKENGSFVKYHVLETYKGLVYSHYKENVNGNFDHCTKEVLAVLQTEESSQSEEEAK